jgi:hypothetical protein
MISLIRSQNAESIAHGAKRLVRILGRRIERKSEDVHGGNRFGFRREKGTRDAVGMLGMISGRTVDMDEKLCACFVNWQQVVDHVVGPN